MQSTTTTDDAKRRNARRKKSLEKTADSIVRSVRFLPDQWQAITAKCDELGVPVGKFLRNAALAASGAPTESLNLRKLADTLDGLPVSRVVGKPAARK
jgi:hypothetical protein